MARSSISPSPCSGEICRPSLREPRHPTREYKATIIREKTITEKDKCSGLTGRNRKRCNGRTFTLSTGKPGTKKERGQQTPRLSINL